MSVSLNLIVHYQGSLNLNYRRYYGKFYCKTWYGNPGVSVDINISENHIQEFLTKTESIFIQLKNEYLKIIENLS